MCSRENLEEGRRGKELLFFNVIFVIALIKVDMKFKTNGMTFIRGNLDKWIKTVNICITFYPPLNLLRIYPKEIIEVICKDMFNDVYCSIVLSLCQ